jgi:hypothetical protein
MLRQHTDCASRGVLAAPLIALLALTGALPVMLTACATSSREAPHEIFEEQSGNTLLVVGKPFVFARERTDVAAHARDYATLVAVQVDQSGNAREYLLLYRWSTVDPRMSPPPDPKEGQLRILAEGRSIDLKPLAELPTTLSRGKELHVPRHGDVLARAYAADPATLRYIAASRELMIRMPEERLDTPFGIFEDGRGALAEFLQNVGL